MARFQVATGVHLQHGREYGKGDIVESFEDLCAMFRNKFIRVEDASRLSAGKRLDASPAREALNMVEIPPEAPKGQKAATKPATEKTPAPATPKGTDVTKRYPVALEQDFKVFKSEKLFYVYDADDLAKPVNDVGVGRDDVDKVIQKALKK